MEAKETSIRSVGIYALGVLLSTVLFFMAAVPLRYVRIKNTRLMFTVLSVVSCSVGVYLGFYGWALSFALIAASVALYAELENLDIPMFYAALVSVFAPFSVGLIGVGVLAKAKTTTIFALVHTHLEPVLKEVSEVYSKELIEEGISFLPSLVLVCMMFIIFVSLAFDLTIYRTRNQREWGEFSLPDVAVWAFMLALLGTFLVESPLWQTVAKNLLVVVMAGYFFQGLSVTQAMFKFYQVGYFWRFLILILVFTQFFALMSLLGLSDYWLEYRKRFSRPRMNLVGR